MVLLFVSLTAGAEDELKGIVDPSFLDESKKMEELVNKLKKSGKYDLMLELKLRDLAERSRDRTFYSKLLVEYTGDIQDLLTYGKNLFPDDVIKLCKDTVKKPPPLERYKMCFQIHGDGRFYRGVYAEMDVKDEHTRRWMEDNLKRVRLYREYAYHALGLLYYKMGWKDKAVQQLTLAGRIGLAPLLRLYLSEDNMQKAKEIAQRLKEYSDLTEEERRSLDLYHQVVSKGSVPFLELSPLP